MMDSLAALRCYGDPSTEVNMSETIYAPPEADVAVTATDGPDFYVVAPRKFYLLSILTLNAYFVYWFYRNWHLIKRRTGESVWPPMRGIFYIFFAHSLFTDVEEKIKTLGQSFIWRPSYIATWVVVLAIGGNVLDRLAARSIGSPATDLFALALVPLAPAILLNAQRAINFACEDPAGSTNESLTLANWVWVVLGGLLWLFILFGLYASLFDPELLAE